MAKKGVWVLFFKNMMKRLWGLCILGFVVGVIFAFVMPPIIIALIEAVILALLCIAIYCCK